MRHRHNWSLSESALIAFVRESNHIESITRDPTQEELDALRDFLELERFTVTSLQRFVDVVQPGAKLRRFPGMNVIVGQHRPPDGCPEIEVNLDQLCEDAMLSIADPFEIHRRYETLHAFMDGNGRSGRALWLWMMVRRGYDGRYAFLRAFYYQALDAGRPR